MIERKEEIAIIKKYPRLFQSCSKSSKYSNMSFGMEIGFGWMPIIDQLSAKIEKLTHESWIKKIFRNLITKVLDSKIGEFLLHSDKFYHVYDFLYTYHNENVVRYTQIKEKFGLLRVYLVGDAGAFDGPIYQAVDEAEKKSAHICEDCGDEGSMKGYKQGRSWIKTLCEPCHQKDLKERKERYKN